MGEMGSKNKNETSDLPVSFLDLVLRSVGLDAQGVVELGLLHHGDDGNGSEAVYYVAVGGPNPAIATGSEALRINARHETWNR
jgi:hypothetical protein